MYFLTGILLSADIGYVDHACSERCFGYHEDKQSALEAVDLNLADMHEDTYNWLVVEKISAGLHVQPEEEIWYAWDDGLDKWVHADKPVFSEKIVNWSIG